MKTLWISVKFLLFFTILTGIIYPVLVTAVSQVSFPARANGSLVFYNGKLAGSKLIGQQFDSPVYFSSRPSSIAYNPLPSGGSNYALTNAKLKRLVSERKKQFISFNNLDSLTDVPAEMLFASSSGLDPHISPRAALLQVDRVAKARSYSEGQKKKLREMIDEKTKDPQFHLMGEERINVFLLNLSLDSIK